MSRSLGVRGEAGDERAVELELANREVAQVGERGEPGAEVVDRDDQAEVAELLDDDSRAVEVGDDAGLGDLEDERLGRQLVQLEELFDQGR